MVLPTLHASTQRYYRAGGNCIVALTVIGYDKTKDGKRTVTLELPDWADDDTRQTRQTRFAITMMGKYGFRVLAFPNQARHHFDTEEAAQKYLQLLLANDDLDKLRNIYGDLSKLEVRPVECYANGGAVGIYFD